MCANFRACEIANNSIFSNLVFVRRLDKIEIDVRALQRYRRDAQGRDNKTGNSFYEKWMAF